MVYCSMGLNLKRRTKKRVPVRERQSMEVPDMPNRFCSFDFFVLGTPFPRTQRAGRGCEGGSEYSNRYFITCDQAGTGNGRDQSSDLVQH